MSKVLVTDTYLTNIADAIRTKNGETTTYKPSEMANAIEGISGSGTSSGVSLSDVSVYVGDYSESDTLSVSTGAVNVYTRTITA